MKKGKKLLLVFMVLLLCLCSCAKEPVPITADEYGCAEQESIRDRLVREIDGEYKKEVSDPENFRTVSMIELAIKYSEKWDAVIEEYYNKIMELPFNNEIRESGVLQTDVAEDLAKLKAAWEQYYQAECQMYEQYLLYKFYGGRMASELRAANEYSLKMDFALKIVEFYEMFIWQSDITPGDI